MIHLGDITQINGGKIEPVNVITFGSPCQDLSVAGKRAGLSGNQSGLFVEAIRIIKEMRDKTNGKYPEYAVWENVPGAFSSNGGDDFKTVLQEISRITDSTVSVPKPKKWDTAGTIMGNGWSVAWRVLDAQYWGVPQRRRRIYLVADFGGGRAGEILFKPQNMQDASFAYSASEQQSSANAAGSLNNTSARIIHSPVICLAGNTLNRSIDSGGAGKGWKYNISYTLTTKDYHAVMFDNHGQDHRISGPLDVAATVTQSYGTGGNNTPIVCELNPIKAKLIRRITPLECERLQGFPDGWTDIPTCCINGKLVKTSDSARYKALGNSVALPCVSYVLKNLSQFLSSDATLGSLFDGIGGFPLIWERLHGSGTAVWASEISRFPIAVTTYHFPIT